MRRSLTVAAAAAALVVCSAVPAFAQEAPGAGTQALTESLNLLWIVVGAMLVIFMQAGFALVETGFCRAKHATHVVMTNFSIFGLGFAAFFLVGFPLMFGGFSYPGAFGLDEPVGSALIGSGDWVFLWKGPMALSGLGENAAVMAFFLYMAAFMDTVATIPTGSMAERWKFKSFAVWGLFCGAVFYPLFGAWTWGGGWLSKLGESAGLGNGYVDFAGSGVVHAMGGAAALAGAVVIGPRVGKYAADGTPRTLAGHHVPMATLGAFILLFGWFGFNAASTFAATDTRFAIVAANTAIAGAFGSVVALVWSYARLGKPDPGMLINGLLAGLVAVTAPCAFISPGAAAVIGCVSGVLVIEATWVIERRLKIDDPVGAIAVHFVHGLFGVLCVGLFANGTYGAGWNGTDGAVTGLFYGGGLGQLGAQAIGAAVVAVGFTALAWAFFTVQNRFLGGIRSTVEDEVAGLDRSEMGAAAYPEFEHVVELPEQRERPYEPASSSAS